MGLEKLGERPTRVRVGLSDTGAASVAAVMLGMPEDVRRVDRVPSRLPTGYSEDSSCFTAEAAYLDPFFSRKPLCTRTVLAFLQATQGAGHTRRAAHNVFH